MAPRSHDGVSYFHDPETDKKTSVTAKSKRAQRNLVAADTARTRKCLVSAFYTFVVFGSLCNIVALATVAWYDAYIEQSTLTVDGDLMTRRCTFAMSYSGLKVFIDYKGDAETVQEMDSYRMFSKPLEWPANYASSLETMDFQGKLMLAFTILGLLAQISCALMMSYGLWRVGRIKRKPYLFAFAGAFAMNIAAISSVFFFITKSKAFRTLLKEESVARDTEPELAPSFSMFIIFAALGFNLASLYPFWKVMPQPEETREEEEMAALQKERAKRIKQYLDDVQNDSYLREHWTILPDPETTKPRRLDPLEKQSGFRAESLLDDSPMETPGGTLEAPVLGQAMEMESLPGFVPETPPSRRKGDASLPPVSSPLFSMRSEMMLASGAQRTPTRFGSTVLLPTVSEEVKAERTPQQPVAIPKETVLDAWAFRAAEGKDNSGIPEDSRPVTRERPVTRAPPPEKHGKRQRTDLEVVVTQNSA